MDKLSPAMIHTLECVRVGLGTHGWTSGKGSYGRATRTARALRRRGLLDGCELTDAGAAALKAVGSTVPDGVHDAS